MSDSIINEIPMEYVRGTCKIGKGSETCAFLFFDVDGFQCSKGTSLEEHLRKRLDEGTINSRGDNCEGYNHEQEETT